MGVGGRGCYPRGLRESATSLNLTVEIPSGLFKVLDGITFVVGTPDILHGIAETEVHVLGDGNTLNPGGVGGIVGWVVHRVYQLWFSHGWVLWFDGV
jgi:hypothetical protein